MAGLTEEMTAAVIESWEGVKKNVRQSGIEFYLVLFEEFPSYQDFFKDFKDVSMDDLPKHPKLRMHGVRAMYALSSMVETLDELDVCGEIMRKTVDDHYPREIREIHFKNMFSIFPTFMKRRAGDKYTSTAKEGWDIIFSVLMDVVNGRFAELDEQTRQIEGATDEKAGLTEERREAVIESWAGVKKDVRQSGIDFYLVLFRQFPSYQDFFKDFRGVSMEDLPKNPKLRMHGVRAMYALSSMVETLDELDVCGEIMRKTVDDHYPREIREIHFKNMFSIFPTFMELRAGDKFTSTAKEGWDIIFSVLMDVVNGRFAELDEQTRQMEGETVNGQVASGETVNGQGKANDLSYCPPPPPPRG